MKHRSNRRPPKHVSAVIAFLREAGAEVADVVVSRCYRLTFIIRGLRLALRVPLSEEAVRAVRFARAELHRMLTRGAPALPMPA